MSAHPKFGSRPLIYEYDGKLCHQGSGPCNVQVSPGLVSADCTDITHEAIALLYKISQEYLAKQKQQ